MSTIQTLTSICLAAGLAAGRLLAQDQTTAETSPPERGKAAKPSPGELRDKQLDVSLETRDIERVLGKLKKASDLAKQRITEAAVTTESVTTSLNKGDSSTAKSDARAASEKFKEIVKQLEVLLKEETPQQIAEAKQLAEQLAKMEREFAEKFDGVLNPPQAVGNVKVDPKSQVKPMHDPDTKAPGNDNKNGTKSSNQGKSGAAPKESGKETSDSSEGSEKTDPKTGDDPIPDGQGNETPDGQNTPRGDLNKPDDMKTEGGKEANDRAGNDPDAKKPGTGVGRDTNKGNNGDKKTPEGGTATEPDLKKPGTGGGRDTKKGSDGDKKTPEGGTGTEPDPKKPRAGPGRDIRKGSVGDKKTPEGGTGTEPDPKKPGAGPGRDTKKGSDGDKKTPEGGIGTEPDPKKPGTEGGQDKDTANDGGVNTRDGRSRTDTEADKSGTGSSRDRLKTTKGDDTKPGGDASSKEKSDSAMSDEGKDGLNGDVSKDTNRNGAEHGKNDDRSTVKQRSGGAAPTAEELREAVAQRAEKLAATGKTLQDVLNAIARSNDPADKDAAGKIQVVLKEIDIDKLAQQMDGVSGMIRTRKDADAKLSSVDAAERLEVMAQRLDAAYRGIVAPKAEAMRNLEASLVELREKLDQLETPAQVIAWHREARDLLDQLDKLGVSLETSELLEKEMKKAGFGLNRDPTRRNVDWNLISGRYAAPDSYGVALVHLQEDIQNRIQTLILGDLGNLADDATPPKYRQLVERYYEVLSRQRTKPGPEVNSKPAVTSEMRKPK